MSHEKNSFEIGRPELFIEALYEIVEKCLERLEVLENRVEEHTQQLKYLRH